jgi:hypothetical protein
MHPRNFDGMAIFGLPTEPGNVSDKAIVTVDIHLLAKHEWRFKHYQRFLGFRWGGPICHCLSLPQRLSLSDVALRRQGVSATTLEILDHLG